MTNINLPVPFFTQRDNTYVWYYKHEEDIVIKKVLYKKGSFVADAEGKEISKKIWDYSCNITCLAMVLNYLGVTKDSPYQMCEKIFAEKYSKDDSDYESDFDRYITYRKGKFSEDKGFRCIENISILGEIAKDKSKGIYKIRALEYKVYGSTTDSWEYFLFNDLFIKPLNEKEIGFFITETGVSFTVDRTRWDECVVSIKYYTCKDQVGGSNSTEFLRVNIQEDLAAAFSDSDKYIRIAASSYLFDPQSPLRYSIQNAFDGNPATSYVENTEDDLMKIEFSGFKSKFSKKVALGIINGYALNEKYYYANNRIIGLNANSYRINDEKTELIAREPIQLILKDGIYKYQILSFDYNNRVGSFSFSTAKIIKGNSFNDTCIAEINLSETDNFVFGEINE